MNICPSTSSSSVAVGVKVRSLSGIKLADEVETGKLINFDVKARMEEKERRSGWVSVDYVLKVGTKPNVVKFEAEGIATLEGKDEEIRRMLEADPETQVPVVFQRVYQHVFLSMYLLATLINAPYPPANLLNPNQQQMPVVQMDQSTLASGEEMSQPRKPVAEPKEETTGQTSGPVAAPERQRTVQPTQRSASPEDVAMSEEGRTIQASAEARKTEPNRPRDETSAKA